MKFVFFYCDMSSMPSDSLICKTGNNYYILIDNKLNIYNKIFKLSHELGHYYSNTINNFNIKENEKIADLTAFKILYNILLRSNAKMKNRAKLLCLKHNITLDVYALKLGVTKNRALSIWNDRAVLTNQEIKRNCDIFGVSEAYFLCLCERDD